MSYVNYGNAVVSFISQMTRQIHTCIHTGLFMLIWNLVYWTCHHYLTKFTFWQVCWFNGLSVCLSVCLFIRSRITIEPFEISSAKLVHRCILVAAPSLFLFNVNSQSQGHEGTAKVKIRNRRNSVNFWATAKLKKPQCSTHQGPSLWHHQLPVSIPV